MPPLGTGTAGKATQALRTAEAVDPHLDSSILIAASDPGNINHAAAVGYLKANQPLGLSASRRALREFLTKSPTRSGFRDLQKTYGIKLARNIPTKQINALVDRLQKAFTDGRVLRDGDARIAAEAMLRSETLATADLPFFKRAKDLGIDVEFVGSSGGALSKAANYKPNPVTIPPP